MAEHRLDWFHLNRRIKWLSNAVDSYGKLMEIVQ